MTRCCPTRSHSLSLLRRAIQVGALLLCLSVSPSLAQIIEPLGRIGTENLGARSAIGLSDFGISIANVGDLDGDGITDVAALSLHQGQGALWVLFLNADGTVRDRLRLAHDTDARLPKAFGWTVAALGDLTGDGTLEVAVTGTMTNVFDDRQRLQHLWLFSLGPGGALADVQRVVLPNALRTQPHRVYSLAAAGDLDGDGRSELALGVTSEVTNDHYSLLFFLDEDAQVTMHHAYRPGDAVLAPLGDLDGFGEAVAGIGDVDGDGIPDLAVGAVAASGTHQQQGAVAVLFMHRAPGAALH
ncbi:MAG: FG-GAP-like repeat-containing protein [Bacteroidota bacterium]